MAVYSKRLAGPTQVTAAGQTLFTVPTGRVYVVRQVAIVIELATAVPNIIFGVDGTGNRQRFFRRALVGDSDYQYTGRWVFEAAKFWRAIAGGLGAGQTADVTLWGYDLAA